MTTKEYLSQILQIDHRIQAKLEQAEKLRGLATKITTTFSDMPRVPGHSQQSMEEAVCKLVDLQKKINADVDRMIDLRQEVMTIIESVPVKEQRYLLEWRYLNGWTWGVIARGLGYDRSSVYRIHAEVLKKLKIPTNV